MATLLSNELNLTLFLYFFSSSHSNCWSVRGEATNCLRKCLRCFHSLRRFWKSATRQWNRFDVIEMTRMNWPEISKIADGLWFMLFEVSIQASMVHLPLGHPFWINSGWQRFKDRPKARQILAKLRETQFQHVSNCFTSYDQDRAKARIARHFNAGDRLEMWINDTFLSGLWAFHNLQGCVGHTKTLVRRVAWQRGPGLGSGSRRKFGTWEPPKRIDPNIKDRRSTG